MAIADGIVTNTIMSRLAAPDTLLGVNIIIISFFLQKYKLFFTNFLSPIEILNFKHMQKNCNYFRKIAQLRFA